MAENEASLGEKKSQPEKATHEWQMLLIDIFRRHIFSESHCHGNRRVSLRAEAVKAVESWRQGLGC
jgi:hypothetical protein